MRPALAAALLALACSAPATAGPAVAIVQGQVVDGGTGAPVDGAAVLANCTDFPYQEFTFTDSGGVYTFTEDLVPFTSACGIEVIHPDHRILEFTATVTFEFGTVNTLDPVGLRRFSVIRTANPSLLPETSGFRVQAVYPNTGHQWHFDGTGPVNVDGAVFELEDGPLTAGDRGRFYVLYETLDGFARFNRNGQLMTSVAFSAEGEAPSTVRFFDASQDGLALVVDDRLVVFDDRDRKLLDQPLATPDLAGLSHVGETTVVLVDGTSVRRRDGDGTETVLRDYPGDRVDAVEARDGVVHVLYGPGECTGCGQIDRLDLETGTVLATVVTGMSEDPNMSVNAQGEYLVGACRFAADGTPDACLGDEVAATYLADSPLAFATGVFGSTFDSRGQVLVKDINRVLRFRADGTLLQAYRAFSPDDDGYLLPTHVAPLAGGFAVLDARNRRLQFRATDGSLVRSVAVTADYAHWHDFESRGDLVAGHDGAVYLATGLGIQRVDPATGGVTVFHAGEAAALDYHGSPGHYVVLRSAGYVVLDTAGVQQGGEVVISSEPVDLALTSSGAVAVLGAVACQADPGRRCGLIEFFSAAGAPQGTVALAYRTSSIAALGDDGFVVTGTDTDLGAVQLLDAGGAPVAALGGIGFFPGQFGDAGAGHAAVDALGRILVTDPVNHRIQVFEEDTSLGSRRAIIVAGGGPYAGNVLWPATLSNAIGAYLTLGYRGFSKSDIRFLAPDPDLDLDRNGLLDDIDGAANRSTLQEAITGPFAAQAEELLVYLVDHGGDRKFRLNAKQTVSAQQLGGWLDTWQGANPGARLIVVYDACQSGSFVPVLGDPARERYLVASSLADENAYFLAQGALSFSSLFWGEALTGATLGEAYDQAQQQAIAILEQTPLLDADGDGLANQQADRLLAAPVPIGGAPVANATRPVIASVTAPQALNGQNEATLTAFSVTDLDPIARVWAVIRPPGFSPDSVDNPVQALLTLDLERVEGTDDYSGTFEQFDTEGTFEVIYNAVDVFGNTAEPRLSTVTVTSPLRKRVVLVEGWSPVPARRSVFRKLGARALAALDQQGLGPDGQTCPDRSCDSIQHLSALGASAADDELTLATLTDALTIWPGSDTSNLALYLVADHDGGGFRLNAAETLTAGQLDDLLDGQTEPAIAGRLVVVIDGDASGGFVGQLDATAGRNRVLIGSAAGTGEAAFLSGGQVAFSSFFFKQVLNGATVGSAFRLARQALSVAQGQLAVLDDNDNGIGNDLLDGIVANRLRLGNGVLMAGDEPIVGEVSVNTELVLDEERITVSEVTSTGEVAGVTAVVRRPDGVVVDQPLPKAGEIYSERSYGLCGTAGAYEIAVFAEDVEGNTSLPVLATAQRTSDCSEFLFFSGFE